MKTFKEYIQEISEDYNRRSFLAKSAVVGGGVLGGLASMTGCTDKQKEKSKKIFDRIVDKISNLNAGDSYTQNHISNYYNAGIGACYYCDDQQASPCV